MDLEWLAPIAALIVGLLAWIKWGEKWMQKRRLEGRRMRLEDATAAEKFIGIGATMVEDMRKERDEYRLVSRDLETRWKKQQDTLEDLQDQVNGLKEEHAKCLKQLEQLSIEVLRGRQNPSR